MPNRSTSLRGVCVCVCVGVSEEVSYRTYAENGKSCCT